MGSEWKQRRFGDLCDITRGGSPRPIHDFIRNEGIPWVKISDATSSGSRFIKETSQFIKPEGKSKSREVFPGDLIVSNSATPGIPRFMDIYACVHDGWLLLRNFRELDKEFCFYLIEQEKPALLLQGNGSVFTNLKTDILKNHRVFLPPIHEQKYIARILGTLDDKIELNRQMNTTLERMAQELFKSWFVDFDPVIDNALAAGNPIPEPLQARAEIRKALGVQRKSLPDVLQQQFPERFVLTDEMGWIPDGWDVASLDEIIDLIGGGTPKTSIGEYWNGNIPWFSVVDAPDPSNVFVQQTEKYITEDGLKNSSAKLLTIGTTIISARGTVGKCALVGKPMAMNQSCYGIQGKSGIADYFVYYTVLLRVSELQQRGHGSVFNTITRETFRSIKTPICAKHLTIDFHRQIEPYFSRILKNNFQIECLSKLRDTLLPKLLSGELQVPEAEAIIDQQLAEV